MPWQKERGSHFPAAVRRQILRDHPACQLHLPGCTQTSTEADHITPTSQGGTNDPSNGRGVCHHCHQVLTQQQAANARAERSARARRATPKHPGLR